LLWRLLAAVEIGIDLTTLQVVCIVFIATLIRSAFGFGEALVAVPLLAFYIPLEQAAPLAVLVSITIAAIVVVQDWKKIHLRSTAWLRHEIMFDHEPLERVAAEFNRFAPKPIEIATPALRSLQISGVFATDDTEAFIAFLRTLKGVRVEVTATNIRVSQD